MLTMRPYEIPRANLMGLLLSWLISWCMHAFAAVTSTTFKLKTPVVTPVNMLFFQRLTVCRHDGLCHLAGDVCCIIILVDIFLHNSITLISPARTNMLEKCGTTTSSRGKVEKVHFPEWQHQMGTGKAQPDQLLPRPLLVVSRTSNAMSHEKDSLAYKPCAGFFHQGDGNGTIQRQESCYCEGCCFWQPHEPR